MSKQKCMDNGVEYFRENPLRLGFTLVELVITITILAILGTIAFISLQGYSSNARDSVRISDIQNVRKALEIFSLDTGKYPLPDNPTDVTFSGSTVRTQGTVGDNMRTNLSRNLSTKPLDPLSENEYIYSVTMLRTEYEVLSIYESDNMSYNALNQANAATQSFPKINGTYNGVAVKTPKYIVPTPSIINASLPVSNQIDLETNINSQITTGGDNNIAIGIQEAETGNLDINFNYYEVPANGEIDRATLGLVVQDTYTGSSLADEGIYQAILASENTVELVSLIGNTVLKNTQDTGTSYASPICEDGYNYESTTKKCESEPTCDSGFTYDDLNDNCEKIDIYAATTTLNKRITYKYNSGYSYTVTSTYAQLALLNSSGPEYLYGSSVINGDGILTSSRLWSSRPGYTYDYFNLTGLSLGYNQTKVDGYRSVTNLTTTANTCPSGGTISGTTCTNILTENSTCGSDGILDTSNDKCELEAECNNGWFFNESIDSCQK